VRFENLGLLASRNVACDEVACQTSGHSSYKPVGAPWRIGSAPELTGTNEHGGRPERRSRRGDVSVGLNFDERKPVIRSMSAVNPTSVGMVVRGSILLGRRG
jgi:hypothetical protein